MFWWCAFVLVSNRIIERLFFCVCCVRLVFVVGIRDGGAESGGRAEAAGTSGGRGWRREKEDVRFEETAARIRRRRTTTTKRGRDEERRIQRRRNEKRRGEEEIERHRHGKRARERGGKASDAGEQKCEQVSLGCGSTSVRKRRFEGNESK